jgi:hypothetical protein
VTCPREKYKDFSNGEKYDLPGERIWLKKPLRDNKIELKVVLSRR